MSRQRFGQTIVISINFGRLAMKVSDKISDAVRMRLEVEQVVYPLLLVEEKE